MWARYLLISLIALLVGAVLGAWLLPSAKIITPAITQLTGYPDTPMFAVANPRTNTVTVYRLLGREIEVIGKAKY
ncbi:MAG: hypothetical protein QHH26_06360 [Armatimonadota bacterium]|nr:hypothetical protein [Armatimonadota bacterium]